MKKPFYFLIAFGLALLIPLIVMFLWNQILVAVMGWKVITYLQALGIFVLCKILFGGIGFRGRPGPHFGGFKNGAFHFTEEERAAFKTAWMNRKKDCNS